MTSHFITYPDLVDSTKNHSVLLIDPSQTEIENICLFCKEEANAEFDIYLYNSELNDLQWLGAVTNRVSTVLLSANSTVTISAADVIVFGLGEDVVDPLSYFRMIDAESYHVDKYYGA